VFFICPRQYALLSRSASAEYASTWLGEPASAASGGIRAAGERPGALTADLSFSWGFFISNRTMFYYPAIPANVRHSTWLARSRAAPSGRNSPAKRPGRVGHCRIPYEEAQQMLGFFFLHFWKKNEESKKMISKNQKKGGKQNLTLRWLR